MREDTFSIQNAEYVFEQCIQDDDIEAIDHIIEDAGDYLFMAPNNVLGHSFCNHVYTGNEININHLKALRDQWELTKVAKK